MYDAVLAETVRLPGHDGDLLEAYAARPLDATPRGGVVVVHHLPGYDRETKEYVRRLASLGWNAVCPHLYSRWGADVAHDDAAAAARAEGGVPDEQVLGDLAGASAWLRALSNGNGRVAVMGHCSGGRHSFLAATALPVQAAVICYGGAVVGETPSQYRSMVPLVDRAPSVSCPVLGLYGDEDHFPTPAQVDELEAAMSAAGKDFEVHRYPGAGHAFFSPDRPSYRVEAAVDGWQRIADFLDRHLGGR